MRFFCDGCQKEHEDFNWVSNSAGHFCKKFFSPSWIEVVPQRIKLEREKYKKEILQPFRAGELSKEWCEAYPDKAIKNYGKERVKRARNVWK